MLLTGPAPAVSTDCVEPYAESGRPSTARCIARDTYWTAERVLSAPERFRVFLAVEDRQLLGYLDVTYGCDINEPYDLLVRPGLPFRKYAVPLLAEAVRRNGPNRMMALVYTDGGGGNRGLRCVRI